VNRIEIKNVRTEIRKSVELSRDDILRLLSQIVSGVPENASVTVHVPGGGDWSNMSLDLSHAPVYITWTEVEETHE
jgi:hypothetical protein